MARQYATLISKRGWLNKYEANARNVEIDVGILKKEGSTIPSTYKKATLAQVAYWQHDGIPAPPMSETGAPRYFIPPRPFLTGWLHTQHRLLALWVGLELRKNIKNPNYLRLLPGRIGLKAARGVQAFIESDGHFIPNASSTIRKKKSARPLVDNGQLKSSISFEVK